jgi:para-nitrobenzyl esterase
MTQITIGSQSQRDSSRCDRNWHRVLAIGFLLFGACAAESHTAEDEVQAQTGNLIAVPDGSVRGSTARGTRSFIGIPYAAAPVGALRWKPPMLAETWSGTFDATGPGVACFQSDSESTVEQSEDCLRLNVFAPEKQSEQLLPVLVWLHGGDNVRGSANDLQPFIGARLYDGASLREYAKTEVVVVTVNYRLGALGFLAHEGLTAETGTSGNYGLMDQQAALFWVQRSIRAFGGDPSRVTLFGQGTGATDACYQLVARDADDLVHAAVLESGSCSQAVLAELPRAQSRGAAFARELGCDRDQIAETLACLRAKPAGEFASSGELMQTGGGMPATGALAIVDGQFIREQPKAAFAAGRFEQVPMIVGTNAREGSYFMREHAQLDSGDAYRTWLTTAFGSIQAGPIAAEYSVADSNPHEVATQLITDAFFTCPAQGFADLASAHADVYRYAFERAAYIAPLEGLGATHSAELLWVWDVWPRVSPYAGDDVGLSQTIAGYWSRLVDGDPNGKYSPEWPRYEPTSRQELVLDIEISTRQQRDARCEFWQKLRSGETPEATR